MNIASKGAWLKAADLAFKVTESMNTTLEFNTFYSHVIVLHQTQSIIWPVLP